MRARARKKERTRKRERAAKDLLKFYNKQIIDRLEYIILYLSLDYADIMHKSEEFEEYIREAYLGYLRYTCNIVHARVLTSDLFTRAKYMKISWISRCVRAKCLFSSWDLRAGARSQFCATSMSRMSSIARPPD